MKSDAFPNIPRNVFRHVDYCNSIGQPNRLTEALVENRERVLAAIDRMFAQASKISGVKPDKLLKATGFNLKDCDPTRIESAFAEIRTVNFLVDSQIAALGLTFASGLNSGLAERQFRMGFQEAIETRVNTSGEFPLSHVRHDGLSL